MATRLTPFWPRPATTSGSLWPGSGLCALCSGPLSGSSHTAAAPLHHKLKRLNSLFHRRQAAAEPLAGSRDQSRLERQGCASRRPASGWLPDAPVAAGRALGAVVLRFPASALGELRAVV